MRKYVFLIFLIFLLAGCYSGRNNYLSTVYLHKNKCNCNLYVETYRAGIMGSLTADYLTDSVNFRFYTGTYNDETGYIYYNCKGDSITIEKLERDNETFKVDSFIINKKLVVSPKLKYTLKTVDSTTYSLKRLKEQHLYD